MTKLDQQVTYYSQEELADLLANADWVEGDGGEPVAIERQAFVFEQEGLATPDEIARLAQQS